MVGDDKEQSSAEALKQSFDARVNPRIRMLFSKQEPTIYHGFELHELFGGPQRNSLEIATLVSLPIRMGNRILAIAFALFRRRRWAWYAGLVGTVGWLVVWLPDTVASSIQFFSVSQPSSESQVAQAWMRRISFLLGTTLFTAPPIFILAGLLLSRRSYLRIHPL